MFFNYWQCKVTFIGQITLDNHPYILEKWSVNLWQEYDYKTP